MTTFKCKIIRYSILILIVFVIFMIGNSLFVVLKRTSDIIVINSQDDKINSSVFINSKTIRNEKTEELILLFHEHDKYKFVTLAIPPKLIGYNNYGAGYLRIGKYLFLSKSSLVFPSLNEGYDLLINKFEFGEDTISFETFDIFTQYGPEIRVIKSKNGL